MTYDSWPNLATMFFEQAAKQGDKPFLWDKRNGEWQSVSWSQAAGTAAALARALKSLGIEPGDRVSIVSESRSEWPIADIAIMAARAITVPHYTTNSVSDHQHVLNDGGAKGAIVSTRDLAKNLLPAALRAPRLEFVIAIEDLEQSQDVGVTVHDWSTLLEQHAGPIDDVVADCAGIARTDTSCLIYTSGTGGAPKGVMLSHGAIICNCKGACDVLLEIGLKDDVFLSFLPLSHSYEHTAGLFFPISIGAQIYYAEGIDKLAANMVETRPTIMTAVPRLYETMHGRIIHGLKQAGGLKQKLFMKAVDIGRRRYENPESLSLWDKILDKLLDRLVRSKVRERFGGRLKALVSGGAPLNYDIGVFFQALGVRLLQGYGQTETAPVVSCNRASKVKIDTVGPPMVDVEVKIAEDGEILVRGELVMQGYWNNPDATAEVMKDGWLHTGDIGEFDEDNYLKITDRKKDIIVNSGGDNISPQRVEGFLCIQPEIEQAMVIGDKRPHLVGLIVPDREFAITWARQNGKPADLEKLIDDEAFKDVIEEAIARVNGNLSVIERVRKFNMTAEAFTVENEMMTPSLKIRRHIIKAEYGDALESLYRR